eukprot:4958914-Prymnesium_polylepis.1
MWPYAHVALRARDPPRIAAGIRSRVEAEVAEAEARLALQRAKRDGLTEKLDQATAAAEKEFEAAEGTWASASHTATAAAVR